MDDAFADPQSAARLALVFLGFADLLLTALAVATLYAFHRRDWFAWACVAVGVGVIAYGVCWIAFTAK